MDEKQKSGVSDPAGFARWMTKDGPVSGQTGVRNVLCMNKDAGVKEALAKDPAIAQLWASIDSALATYTQAVKSRPAEASGKPADAHALMGEIAKLDGALAMLGAMPESARAEASKWVSTQAGIIETHARTVQDKGERAHIMKALRALVKKLA